MSDVKERRTKILELPKIIFYSDESIYIKDVRASYPHLDKPWSMDESGDKKYSIMGLIPKTPEYADSVQALFTHMADYLKERKLQPLPPARLCLRDGDLTAKAEMAGHWTISASEKEPPILRGRYIDARTGQLEVIPPEDAAKVFYGGCWCHLLVRLWFQNHPTGGRRINANLRAVQFVRNDTAFGGRGRITADDVDDTFEPIADDEGGFDKAGDEAAKYDL